MPSCYLCRSYRLPEDWEDLFAFELWSLGALGVHILPLGKATLRADAYYAVDAAQGQQAGALDDAVWRSRGVWLVSETTVDEEDWLAGYRDTVEPFAVGRRFWIDPREPDPLAAPPQDTGRFLLRLPARRAFGTGSHPTTRLVVRLLEQTPPRGLRVLDVGTGSGILSFVAVLLGARQAVGLDADPDAVLLARQNRRLNRLPGRLVPLVAGRPRCLAPHSRFDLVVANLLPQEFVPELPTLVELLAPGARIIFSGILGERQEEVLQHLEQAELAELSTCHDSEWCAVVVTRRWQPGHPVPRGGQHSP